MPLAGYSLKKLAQDLARGLTTSQALVQNSLDAIARDDRAFTWVDASGAQIQAKASDALRQAGAAPSAYAGIPISVKDLFDIQGRPTPAGSAILRQAPAAATDAPIVIRLKAAGFIVIGRTQMSEFAFTGLGLNPHGPQPTNPKDPSRVPGGSSGGAAVSVALGQVAAAIGTDTGGSVRIPAAFCGLTGFKPTQSRITRSGAFPLSTTLDSIGPIARSVEDCAIIDGIMADLGAAKVRPLDIRTLRLGIPNHFLLDELDPQVAEAWSRTLTALSRAGAQLETFDFPELDGIPAMNSRGTISNAEAFAFHRRSGLLHQSALYDPNVLARVQVGREMSAADYLDLLDARSRLMSAAAMRTAPYDAVICPTAPIIAPLILPMGDPEAFKRANALSLRNTSVANLLDRCALSLPMPTDGVPCGLMVMGETLGDSHLLSVGNALEPALN
jgi:aspartyl-tRNA(Asn)/glutamyl-tRNA(Gln) amidotransferase subunit A